MTMKMVVRNLAENTGSKPNLPAITGIAAIAARSGVWRVEVAHGFRRRLKATLAQMGAVASDGACSAIFRIGVSMAVR